MKTAYLSYSGKAWRVIYQGLPLCKDVGSQADAEKAAMQLRVHLSPVMWHGDKGIEMNINDFKG